MTLRASLALGLAFFAGAAHPQGRGDLYTGDWLYEQYVAFRNEAAPGSLLFAAYVSGVVDAQLARQAAGDTPADWCPPGGVLMSEYYNTVGRYLEENFLERRRHRALLVLEALAKAWPCRR